MANLLLRAFFSMFFVLCLPAEGLRINPRTNPVHSNAVTSPVSSKSIILASSVPVPAAIESIPATIESIPATIESIPATIESIPATIESIPATIESVTVAIESVTDAIESVTDAIDSLLADNESIPAVIESLLSGNESVQTTNESLPTSDLSAPINAARQLLYISDHCRARLRDCLDRCTTLVCAKCYSFVVVRCLVEELLTTAFNTSHTEENVVEGQLPSSSVGLLVPKIDNSSLGEASFVLRVSLTEAESGGLESTGTPGECAKERSNGEGSCSLKSIDSSTHPKDVGHGAMEVIVSDDSNSTSDDVDIQQT